MVRFAIRFSLTGESKCGLKFKITIAYLCFSFGVIIQTFLKLRALTFFCSRWQPGLLAAVDGWNDDCCTFRAGHADQADETPPMVSDTSRVPVT